MYKRVLRIGQSISLTRPKVLVPEPVARQCVRATYAIQRREGFVVVTGDIGTGETTLCRALLEQESNRTTGHRADQSVSVEEDIC